MLIMKRILLIILLLSFYLTQAQTTVEQINHDYFKTTIKTFKLGTQILKRS